MKIHLIAIGGAVMHNLALELNANGHTVSGSDDKIYDPAKSRLQKAGLLPNKMGWDAQRITAGIDLIILGMHARIDNPELIKAQELSLKIQSFPQFLAEKSKTKKRIVVAGSHGKTTVTAMIMHVLKKLNFDFDYMVGSSLPGFDRMVRISEAPLMIFEGDEYLCSALDLRPKFVWYKPHLSIITGIAYDHANIYKTYKIYRALFDDFTASLNKDSLLILNSENKEDVPDKLGNAQIKYFSTPSYSIKNNLPIVQINNQQYPLNVIGEHNLRNIESARLVCEELGINTHNFYTQIKSFKGAGMRMEKILETSDLTIIRDFAHAPSKVKGTVDGIKSHYPNANIIALYELHTFSSLKHDFLPHYKNSLSKADKSCVLYLKESSEHKKLPILKNDYIEQCFGNVSVLTSAKKIEEIIKSCLHLKTKTVLLLMSSGNFGGININKIIKKV